MLVGTYAEEFTTNTFVSDGIMMVRVAFIYIQYDGTYRVRQKFVLAKMVIVCILHEINFYFISCLC